MFHWLVNVCQARLISLIGAPNGLNVFPEVCYEFSFIVIGKWTMAFLSANHGMSQIPVGRWGPGTSILMLFRRQT